MPGSPTGPHAAYFEDYNEDARTTLPETRQTANITAKRLKPDIVRAKPVNTTHDEFSDSGYSSKTGATLGSGDSSSLGSKSGAAPLKIDTATATKNEKSRESHQISHPLLHSIRKPTLRRTESKAKGGRCACKECTTKEKVIARSPEKSKSSRDVNAKSASKAQIHAAVPPRPQSTKPSPQKPTQETPISQPLQARPRAVTAQSYQKQRPMSFHAGSLPQVTYQPVYVAPMHPMGPTASPLPPPSYPPPVHSYFPPTPAVQHSPYQYAAPPSPLERRPPARGWISDLPAPQRQSLVYSASPVIEHGQQPQYATAVQPKPIVRRTSIPRGNPYPPREEHYIHDEDYYRMPPPPPPPPKQHTQRPTIRHAATTSVAHAAIYQRRNSRTDTDGATHVLPRSPLKAAVSARDVPQRPSLAARASASSNDHSDIDMNIIQRDMRHMSIESNHSAARRRPVSYYGHESPHDLERSVEAYQASANPDPPFPLTADSLNLVRKKTHTGSETGSRLSTHSKGSRGSSEVKARNSTDRRGGSDVKTRSETDGLTMRFNASQAVNVDLKGASVEGRTISVRPSTDGGDGDMVFSIGGKGGATSSRTSLKDKNRRRSMYVEGSGSRELEPAVNTSRSARGSKTRESSRAPDKKMAASRSRRSSKSGRK